MLQVESKKGNCAQPQGARASSKAIILGASILVLLAVLAVPRHYALSEQSAGLKFDNPARSPDILAHLNAVIQFYRACTQPIQKAGEPNDVVYRDQAVSLVAQVARFAFQWAKAEAALMAESQTHPDVSSNSPDEQQKMQMREENVEKQISNLEAREAALDKERAIAKPRNMAALEAERKQVHGALELARAMKEALQKIVGMAEVQEGKGFPADLDRLQHSVPELQGNTKTAAPHLITLDSAQSSGVTSQGAVLFELLETRHSLDTLINENDNLHTQALALRTPISKILRSLLQEGQQLSQQAVASASISPASGGPQVKGSNPAPAAAPQPNFDSITTAFKSLSAAAVPLSQEIIVLEQNRANLAAWQTSVDREYKSILHSLFFRVFAIGVAFALILGGAEVWSRATNKYVRDIRRRHQLLIVRRVVVGFLSVMVILFGFVTQFNSLATFAGFITAGIAVGLQSILLSVAAYFFIIGRYGVKVGDRITIVSVTGDVIEVGIVRFYIMELAGTGTELRPTGRVVVFSNAVLFQAGTPLYKQMPGTAYAWHELIVKLTETANYKTVCEAIQEEVKAVYDGYRKNVERQHQGVQNWMQAAIDPPVIESRLQLNGGAFQLWVRFPVQIKQASETDEKLIQALLDLMAKSPEIKASIAAIPTIQASIRG